MRHLDFINLESEHSEVQVDNENYLKLATGRNDWF
jgi:hypothetical protein